MIAPSDANATKRMTVAGWLCDITATRSPGLTPFAASRRLRIGEPCITEFHEAMLGNGSRTAGEHAEKGVVVRLIAPQDFERSHGQFRGQPRLPCGEGPHRRISNWQGLVSGVLFQSGSQRSRLTANWRAEWRESKVL